MKLDLGILVGADSKQWLADLTCQIDRLEKLLGKGKTLKEDLEVPEVDEETVETEIDEEEDLDFEPKKPAKKGKKAFEDDEELEEDEDTDGDDDFGDDEEDEEPVAKAKPAKGKAKKLTADDVNDACKKRAASIGGKKGRAEVLGILKKKFKTESVLELKPEQYESCIQAMSL